ncbi:MAG: V-type ATPase subunit [Anaerolineales bacterium]|jgi:V/A-type H+-transporting ATPase subunit C
MFKTGVWGYAGIHARVRAKYSYLITSQEWAELIGAADFTALIGLLRRSVYGPYLMQLDEGVLTPRRAVYQIEKQMADTFTIIVRSTPRSARPLLTKFFLNFEVHNLKAALRGIQARASWDQVQTVLFPLGPISTLPAQAMVESGSVSSAVELLRGTPYYNTLSYAMERYTAEQSLFPLEVALDLNYWSEIWNDLNRLPRQDREPALRTVGSLLDVNNLMWAIRYKIYYHLSEEELINYTLPFGYRLRDADIRAVAAGNDIAGVILRIYPNLPDISALLLDPRKGLPELEIQLLRHVMEQCRKAFIGYPFHIGIPLAYLVLKKMEIQALTALIEAKSSRSPVEEFEAYLPLESTRK